MRRLLYIGIALLCFCSCRDKANTFVLEGRIGSLTHDTIYIYGADALYERIDTVLVRNGAFRYKTMVDTVVPMWVLFPNMHREIVFADKGLKTTMHGDTTLTGHIRISGGEHNALLQQFYHRTDTIEDKKKVIAVADSFIRANPFSEVSIHLLCEYFVNHPMPDNTKIKTLIGSMSGNLQDNNYIKQLQRMLNTYKPLAKNNTVNSYGVRDSEGKIVNTSDYKDTYLLITFWASWDEESRQRQRELIGIKKKYNTRNFDILSVSLDTDCQAWQQAIAEDSVTWRQACDFDGWGTGIVQRMHITHLPSNILVNPSRRVQLVNVYGETLADRIDELTEDKKPEKLEQPDKRERKTPISIKKIKGNN